MFIQRQQIDHLSYRQHFLLFFLPGRRSFRCPGTAGPGAFFACGRPQLTGSVYDHHQSMVRITTGRLPSEQSDSGRLGRRFYPADTVNIRPIKIALRSCDFVKFQKRTRIQYLWPAVNSFGVWLPPRVRVVVPKLNSAPQNVIGGCSSFANDYLTLDRYSG